MRHVLHLHLKSYLEDTGMVNKYPPPPTNAFEPVMIFRGEAASPTERDLLQIKPEIGADGSQPITTSLSEQVRTNHCRVCLL